MIYSKEYCYNNDLNIIIFDKEKDSNNDWTDSQKTKILKDIGLWNGDNSFEIEHRNIKS